MWIGNRNGEIHGHRSSAERGGRPSPTYLSWRSMRKRCGNPKDPNWEFYGGRGISVCERWRDFENFLSDMGERPAGKTLDRYPNRSGNYEPDNCRWANAKEQRRNRQDTKLSVAKVADIKRLKPKMTAAAVARIYGVSDVTICDIWNRKIWV